MECVYIAIFILRYSFTAVPEFLFSSLISGGIFMLKIILTIALAGHILCAATDCLLSYSPKRRIDFRCLSDPEKMREMFADMPLGFPLLSMILGVFALLAMSFGYFGLAEWMEQYSQIYSIIMFVSALVFFIPILPHHVFCGAVEWFYIRLGRTDEAREAVLEFQKKTAITGIVGYIGIIGFTGALFAAVVSGVTPLPQWACIFNTVPATLLLLPTKLPAKGNIAGAFMFLGLLFMI